MFPDKPGGISLYAHEGWRGQVLAGRPDRGLRLLDRLVRRAVDLRQDDRRPDPGPVVPDRDLVASSTAPCTWAWRTSSRSAPSSRSGCSTSSASARRCGSPTSPAPGSWSRWFVFIVLPYLTGDLAQLQHDLDPARLDRLQDRDGLAVPDGLVDLRRRDLRDVRPGVPEHQAGHHDRAPQRPRCSRWSCTCCSRSGVGGVTGAPSAASRRGPVLRGRLRQDRGQRRGAGHPRPADRQPVPVDDLIDGRRLARPVRDRARRHDDQAALSPEPVSTCRRGR